MVTCTPKGCPITPSPSRRMTGEVSASKEMPALTSFFRGPNEAP